MWIFFSFLKIRVYLLFIITKGEWWMVNGEWRKLRRERKGAIGSGGVQCAHWGFSLHFYAHILECGGVNVNKGWRHKTQNTKLKTHNTNCLCLLPLSLFPLLLQFSPSFSLSLSLSFSILTIHVFLLPTFYFRVSSCSILEFTGELWRYEEYLKNKM